MKRIAPLLVAVAFAMLAASTARAAFVPPDSIGVDWSQVPEYRIVPGDLLHLNFGPGTAGTDVVREMRVRPDGRISVYPIGDVIAAGRTPAELKQTLEQQLSAELRQPRIAIEVTEMAGNQVHVLGRVEKPGSYPAGPFSTLLQALSDAGGLSDDAARNSVLIFHRNGASTVAVRRVRVDRLLRGAGDVPLQRFDIVYVPRSTIGNIDVFVRQVFEEPGQIINTAMLGWELFNLDRVFIVRTASR
ncbi:MAG TPA: polysaccharide biosynthesis/export family protein [Candidatus Eisenbacteria bacterium]|nr:polysaccharide biosynthesis/export family protein [Candidatus Eisenbacteria bacterium]